MLQCVGCGGRNPPELDVCSFCHRRLGAQANGARPRRPASTIVATILLLVVLVSVLLIVLVRSGRIA
jgi:hypothetical protein